VIIMIINFFYFLALGVASNVAFFFS
jgi:hypothetical protein